MRIDDAMIFTSCGGGNVVKRLLIFERTYLERLKLACDVLLELAEDDQISDGLEVELRGFKEQVERELLIPDRPEPASM
jgi:hypothetical protein